VRELQLHLVRGRGGPGVLLWPWQDLSPDDAWFEAANMLAVRGIWQADKQDVDFAPQKAVSTAELAGALTRLGRALTTPKESSPPADATAPGLATWGSLHAGFTALGLPADKGLARQKALPLTRGECVRFLWAALQQAGEWQPATPAYLTPGHDSDGDGLADLDDALPFDQDNRNLPDRLHQPAR
jgi:hypothetical protein